MSRAYIDSPGDALVKLSESHILGQLSGASTFADDPLQKAVWQFEIGHLQKIAAALPEAHYFLEFAIPRMGRRADAVIVAGALIFILEYKVGARDFPKHAIEQVHGYALDLKNFHATSHDKAIIPILVCTRAPNQQLDLGFSAADRVNSPLCCSVDDVLPMISRFLTNNGGAKIDAHAWAAGAYLPTPTIIEAAEALYAGHKVAEISRSEAGEKNLSRTATAIEAVVEQMKAEGGKAICFVTGVPGAGKTLAGLNIATGRLAHDIGEDATYLSGNGPLVEVLQTALKRDLARRAKAARKTKESLHLLDRSPDKLIQAVHKFRDEALKHPGPPSEHVVIFDEAQRAWGQEKATKSMAKRNHADFEQSEPSFLLAVMDRIEDWCVIVCLIGDGQEIHDGEAGIGEWFRALQAERRHWKIYAPPRLLDESGPLDAGLRWFMSHHGEAPNPALHLDVPVRSFRSEKVSNFIAALLGEDAEAAATLRPSEQSYPILRTRSLRAARAWLLQQRRGTERSGILAHSNGLRLKPEGLFVKAKIEGPVWFLNDTSDVRSSSALEDVATEFDVQGLELDWTCVAWDLNLHRANSWCAQQFRGTRWQAPPLSKSGISTGEYVLNAYRVLLTRARQGMVIFVPEGDDGDATRLPARYDAIYAWLAACGIPELG